MLDTAGRQRAQAGDFRGERVAEIRMAAGLSQSALAQALGRSQSWVSILEQNYRPLTADDAERVAATVGVAVDDLYAEVGTGIHWLGHALAADAPPPIEPAELELLMELLAQLYPNERAVLIESFVRQARVRVGDPRLRLGRRVR